MASSGYKIETDNFESFFGISAGIGKRQKKPSETKLGLNSDFVPWARLQLIEDDKLTFLMRNASNESALWISPESTGSHSENSEIAAIPIAQQVAIVIELVKLNIFEISENIKYRFSGIE